MKVVLDANVILRVIAEDEPGQARKAAGVFEAAAKGKLELYVTPPVLFEVAWTLRRAYGSSRVKRCSKHYQTCAPATAGVTLSDQAVVEQALATAQSSGLEFADAYITAVVRLGIGITKVATFNAKDFKRSGMDLLPL